MFSAILTVVDRFSGMFWALPIHDTISAKETGALILRRIMLEDARGLCVNFVTDRDQRYLGEAFSHLMTLTGARLTHTSGGRSTSNGKIERIHRYLWRLLEGVGLEQERWVDRLPFAIYQIRTTPGSTSAKYSPIQIETGMQPRSPIASTQGLLRVRNASERDTRDHMQELMMTRDEVTEARADAEAYSKEHFDEKTLKWKHEELLQPGKRVWLLVKDIPLPVDPLMPT